MRRLAVLLAAAVAAGALPVTADAGARAKRGKRVAVKAQVAKRSVRDRGLPAAWRASGWAAPAPSATPAPVGTPVPAPPAPTPTPPPSPAVPAPNPRSVSVGATEFAFTLSQPSVHSGEVRVQLDNSRAEDPHDLVILRGGEAVAHFGEQPAGAVVARRVTLDAGTYALVCPLPRHAERGMQAELRVVASGT